MPRNPEDEPCLHDRLWYHCTALVAHKTKKVQWKAVTNGCKAKKHKDVTKIPMVERNFRPEMEGRCPDCDKAIYEAAMKNITYGTVASPAASSASSLSGGKAASGPIGGGGAGTSASAGTVVGGGVSGGTRRSDSGGESSGSGHTRSGGGASTSSRDRRDLEAARARQAAISARQNPAVHYGDSSSNDFANARGGSEGSGHGSKYDSDQKPVRIPPEGWQNYSSSDSRGWRP